MIWHGWFAVACVLSTPVCFWLSRRWFEQKPYWLSDRVFDADPGSVIPLANSLAQLRMFGDGAEPGTGEEVTDPPDVSWIEFQDGLGRKSEIRVWGGVKKA